MKKINQILKFQVKAISKTICDYTTDNFIRSYAEQLVTLQFPQDKEGIQFLVTKLVDWYDKELNRINESTYIYAKQSHQKSFELLGYLKNSLQNATKEQPKT
jgi:hypothetical protein